MADSGRTEDVRMAGRVKGREAQALAELYDRYGRAAFAVIYRTTGNQATADDLVQETFLRVWNSIAGYDPARGSLGRWILAIARNRAIDYARSWEARAARAAVPVEDWQETTAAGTEADVVLLSECRVVRDAVGRLTARDRQMLDLAFVDGLTHSEIAARLARPLGTVKTWVRGALAALRAEMGNLREREA